MRRAISFLVALLFGLMTAGALAQGQPPKLEPLPEPPPPPPMPSGPSEQSVRIPVQEGDKVEEVREGGRVVAIRVTPPGGKPYFLVDTGGTGNWARRDSLDQDFRVPMFPLHTFD